MKKIVALVLWFCLMTTPAYATVSPVETNFIQQINDNFNYINSRIDDITLENGRCPYYNAADFGIIGDGVTDVTQAWNGALNYMKANGGGVLYVPTGTYIFKSRPTPLSWCTSIVGEGINSTVLMKDYVETEPTNGFISFSKGNGGTKIEFLTLYNQQNGGAAISNVATENGSANFIHIDSLYITGVNLWDYGLYMDGTAKTVDAKGVRNIKVSNTEIYRTALSTAYFKGFAGVALTKVGLYGTGGTSKLDILGASFTSAYFNADLTYCETVNVENTNHVTISCPNIVRVHNSPDVINLIIIGRTFNKEHDYQSGMYLDPQYGISSSTGNVNMWKQSISGNTRVGNLGASTYFNFPGGTAFTFTAESAPMLFVVGLGGGQAGLFFADYKTGTISILSNPSGMFEASDNPSTGKFGVYKDAQSFSISIKNNYTNTNCYVYMLGTNVNNVTDPQF